MCIFDAVVFVVAFLISRVFPCRFPDVAQVADRKVATRAAWNEMKNENPAGDMAAIRRIHFF